MSEALVEMRGELARGYLCAATHWRDLAKKSNVAPAIRRFARHRMTAAARQWRVMNFHTAGMSSPNGQTKVTTS